MDNNVFFSAHEPGPLLEDFGKLRQEGVSMQVVWFGPLLIPIAHISPSANPTKWDQLLSLGEERLHQDVHY